MATVVSVSQDCVGCQLCSGFCPEVFKFAHEEIHVDSKNISEKTIDDIEYAADMCPVDAIIISVQ